MKVRELRMVWTFKSIIIVLDGQMSGSVHMKFILTRILLDGSALNDCKKKKWAASIQRHQFNQRIRNLENLLYSTPPTTRPKQKMKLQEKSISWNVKRAERKRGGANAGPHRFLSQANIHPPKEKCGERNTIISPLSNFLKCQRKTD